jgi:UDP-N-acetyl-L-fucosamine synthase
VLVSTHPRTRRSIERLGSDGVDGTVFHPPFGFHDYVRLQRDARAVLSDSGTISEESSMLGFPAVSLRDAIERPESIDTGATLTVGVEPDSVLRGVSTVLDQFEVDGAPTTPEDYQVTDTSRRVVNFILSTARTHHARNNLRRRP